MFLLLPSAWLSGYEDPVINKINKRIQDLTGLDVSTAEELQVGAEWNIEQKDLGVLGLGPHK